MFAAGKSARIAGTTHDEAEGTGPLDAGAHVVHFYETDDGLVPAIGHYLADAALANNALVLVATGEHRRLFAEMMMRSGVDVTRAIGEGRILMFDAAETIAAISRDGEIDRAAFQDVIGSALRAASAAAGGRPVHAYGEMVALLWADGAINSAIRLEELWNELAEHEEFSLFCAYPQHLFLDLATAERFADVCHSHSSVLGGAPVPNEAEAVRHFPATVLAPRLARRFVVETLTEWKLVGALGETLLVVSELATNAALYGASEFVVALSRHGDVVRVAVSDAGRSQLEQSMRRAHEFGGRGLLMVGALAHDWKLESSASGNYIWAEVQSSD